MKQVWLFIILVMVLCIMNDSCSKSGTMSNPCSGLRFGIISTHTESVGGANNGTITIISPRGDSILYTLDTVSVFGSSWYFINIAPGNHVVTVKNTNSGCTDTVHITVLNYGIKYAAVKQLVIGYCGPCHTNGGQSGGVNLDKDSTIVAMKDRIRIRAVNGTPSYMPPPPNSPLTGPDMQKILDWINAGGTTGN